ncbi:GTP cyclohydrolase I FolE2 [candidate division WOR-3 bacterium]|nr:GTP cyclohydrolase I FolE2 [candidate division WOR-3 bacterium]
MPDVQNDQPYHGIEIDSVGVKDIYFPISVEDRENKTQQTLAKISIFVELPKHFRGTHMSRFVKILHSYQKEYSMLNMGEILKHVRDELDAGKAVMDVSFKYFIKKSAPVSGRESLMDYDCRFHGILGEKEEFTLEVGVPVMTLCPCSKEISDRGAHNQRARVLIRIRYRDFVWIEEMVELAERNSSGALYSLLKRQDEKFVTENAYDNPKFVEDVVRGVADELLADNRIVWFRVECESMESIHNHSAYAEIERDKTGFNTKSQL